MIPFAVLNSLVSDVKKIFACKLSDDFSGFVDTCGTGKRNHAGALVSGNGRIVERWYYFPLLCHSGYLMMYYLTVISTFKCLILMHFII